ncbi:MAG: pilus assembly protein N-terminal domain-containing protein [Hyphomonadaceae bacterium]
MRAHAWINRVGFAAVVLAGAASFLAATTAIAAANDIRVALDQAAPIRLAGSAEGVAIGNPSIAGVSVQNDRLLFVTGRSYGTTNLVVVGAEGRVLYSGLVTVSPDETNVVMVTRGAATARLSCTPLCRPQPDIGDGATTYDPVTEQINGRSSAARTAR